MYLLSAFISSFGNDEKNDNTYFLTKSPGLNALVQWRKVL